MAFAPGSATAQAPVAITADVAAKFAVQGLIARRNTAAAKPLRKFNLQKTENLKDRLMACGWRRTDGTLCQAFRHLRRSPASPPAALPRPA